MTATRRRHGVFFVLVGACAVAIALAVVSAIRQGDPEASAGARDALGAARDDGRRMVVFRSLEGEGRGQLAIAPVSAPGGERTLASLGCDRVYFAGGTGLCLARDSGFADGYRVKVFGPDLEVRDEVAVSGIPSRARVSPDGRFGSVTLFVSGHSYVDDGSFSTQTTLIDLERGEKLGDLEQFTVTRDGKQVTAIDRNFWGVTFADDGDRFYATMATGGKTYLIRGSLSGQVAETIHENVECPSLSPDGTRIAYKSRTNSNETPWRLTVLDLATMRETPLAETRSVDDQAEWLDNEHVLYGVDGEVSVVRADGGGQPRRFAGDAESPAVVRW
jgi:WD40-like Beta Propeller Repeat